MNCLFLAKSDHANAMWAYGNALEAVGQDVRCFVGSKHPFQYSHYAMPWPAGSMSSWPASCAKL